MRGIRGIVANVLIMLKASVDESEFTTGNNQPSISLKYAQVVRFISKLTACV
jgi:hypothetical protein